MDCCVYFIAPHRLKPVDVEFMKEISKVGRCMPCVALQPPAEQCISCMAGDLSSSHVSLWAAYYRHLYGPLTCSNRFGSSAGGCCSRPVFCTWLGTLLRLPTAGASPHC